MRLEKRIGTLMLAVLVSCAVIHAQQRDPRVNPPIAPVPPLPSGESSSSADVTTTPAVASAAAPTKSEPRPAADIEQAGLGIWGGGRSMFTAGFRVGFQGDSNANSSASSSTLQSAATIAGNASLMRNWKASNASLDYSGGGTLYNSRTSLNRQFHNFGLRYSVTGRAWSLTLRDSISLLPESSFGFGVGTAGMLLPGVPGQVQSQLNPLLVPNQSILTTTGRRISNTLAAQVGYALTRRSSLGISSSYGILRAVDSNLTDNHRWSVSTSYNYLLTGKDSLSLSYAHSGLGFENTQFGISGDTVRVGYARQLTGRLSFDIGGGPHFSRFRNPVAGNGTRISASVRSGLYYHLSEADLDFSYTRGITGGSGVLLGADTDQVEGGFSKRLSRMWNSSLRLGYARNVSLVQSTGLTNQFTFNSWYATVGFSRPVGRYARMSLSYGITGQGSNTSLCLGTSCGRSAIRHRFGLSFEFGLPPIALE